MKDLTLAQLTDEQLAHQFKATTDQAYFGEIYRRHHKHVYGICLAMAKDPEAARDLAQDIMIRVMEKLPKLQHEFLLGWWIRSIARNETITYCKRHKKNRFVTVTVEAYPDLAAEETDLESLNDREHLLDGLGQAIEILSEDSRNMLTMKYLQDISIKELQQRFTLSESAVKMRLARARDRVMEIYNKRPGGGVAVHRNRVAGGRLRVAGSSL